jgi:hypothetical protein
MPKVTLVLASGPGFPQGSPERRYELEVSLEAGGLLDPARWLSDPEPWRATRLWPDEAPRRGDVQWDEDTGWWVRFFAEAAGTAKADAPLHGVLRPAGSLRPGDYVTIVEPDGQEFGYRIVSVE